VEVLIELAKCFHCCCLKVKKVVVVVVVVVVMVVVVGGGVDVVNFGFECCSKDFIATFGSSHNKNCMIVGSCVSWTPSRSCMEWPLGVIMSCHAC